MPVTIVAAALEFQTPRAMREETWVDDQGKTQYSYPLNVIVSAPPPNRHHHLLHIAEELGIKQKAPPLQGFLTSEGKFVSRTLAKEIAKIAKQPMLDPQRAANDPNLYSEDLW